MGDATRNTLLWPSGIEHELGEHLHSYTSMDSGWVIAERR